MVEQIVRNALLILDKMGNTVLLGDPNETISRRIARAEVAGERWAEVACSILNVISPNHCAWSLQPGSTGKEIWSWSDPDELPKTIKVPAHLEP